MLLGYKIEIGKKKKHKKACFEVNNIMLPNVTVVEMVSTKSSSVTKMFHFLYKNAKDTTKTNLKQVKKNNSPETLRSTKMQSPNAFVL